MDDFVLGDRELDVMGVLWDLGSGTVSEVRDRLPAELAYTTVLTILRNLEAKGFVGRDRGAAVHVFRALVDRDELIGRRLRAVADSLCGGSLTPLLTHLVEGTGLSAKEQRELRALIDKLDTRRRK